MKRGRALGLIFFGAVTLAAIFFAGRNSFLQWAFKHEQRHIKELYHLNLTVASVRFAAFNVIQVTDLSLQPDSADTLAVIQNMKFKPSLFSLLTGKLSLNEFAIDGAVITAYKEDDRNNLLFLDTYGRQRKGNSVSHANYYTRAEDLKSRILKMLNTAFEINNLQINYRDTVFSEQVYVPHVVYDRHSLSGVLINRLLNDTLDVVGEMVKKDKEYDIAVQHRGNNLNYLPFLDAAHGLKCCFQNITASLMINDAGGELQVAPIVAVQQFHINHWRLAKDDVVFPQAQVTGLLKIKADGFELDSSSTVTLNHASFKLFTSYQTKPDTVFALNVSMPETPADTFFNGLPVGMFNTLKGISCSGTLSYNLKFAINTSQPDSLTFESQLKRKDFHIIHYGNENFTRINEPFIYDAYSGSEFIRHIIVGPENPEFTPYSRITPKLPAAIWQSEDPSFMLHRGFVPEAFRESIAQNFKEKRFARGGSTISMQLVKNVFLTRNKTISRKAEEALIVYLIENLGLVPKERMMEVYLNVIEWGPNVYGVAEASKFYFNKKPSELNLQECIFLAAIIPNPKYFRYQFDKQGELKQYMSDFFKIIEGRMVMRGYLTEHDTINFIPRVKLTGSALQMVLPADSAAPVIDETIPDME